MALATQTASTSPHGRRIAALVTSVVLTAAITTVATAAPEPGESRAARADQHTLVLNACVGAFVRAKQLGGRPMVVRTKESSQPPVRIGNDYHVQLSAVAAGSRQWFGGARCVVQPNGNVVSLNGRPVQAADTATRLADR